MQTLGKSLDQLILGKRFVQHRQPGAFEKQTTAFSHRVAGQDLPAQRRSERLETFV